MLLRMNHLYWLAITTTGYHGLTHAVMKYKKDKRIDRFTRWMIFSLFIIRLS
ncbi:hypothetical protein [Mangrovibacillus cuniculi]|uniref:Uncharacterized protein n=1 Tax=Mangrovibacillus cuniculi TaxID=2593652 RepID=A0A7S8CE15_9BACI|nr:hypothetical protein [Mangrovibacillus cuniculi]QPC48241.1 hypothetical protein G8O30_15605 [Mangrovibacillus cuniculi]